MRDGKRDSCRFFRGSVFVDFVSFCWEGGRGREGEKERNAIRRRLRLNDPLCHAVSRTTAVNREFLGHREDCGYKNWSWGGVEGKGRLGATEGEKGGERVCVG